MTSSISSPSNAQNSKQSVPETQSAIAITQFGEPEVLQYRDGLPVPPLEDKQVLVKIAYASVNPVDYKTRQGKGWGAENIKKNQFAQQSPAILGFDMSGVVVASKVDAFSVGDKVCALSFEGGCYAEYSAVDSHLIAKVPNTVDLKTAGALPCVGITAYQAIEFAKIKMGEHVVLNAPAGGVGHLVLQMLMDKVEQQDIKLTVICSPEKYNKIKRLVDTSKLEGWIDYTKDEDFPKLEADALLDLVGNDAGVRALAVLKEAGRVVVLPSIWVDKIQKAGANKNIQVDGFIAKPDGEDLSAVLTLIEADKLKLHIQAIYPLSQTTQAHQVIEKGDTFGKLVLEV